MFSPENAKTKKLRTLAKGGKVYSLDLPAGLSCPGANLCKSQAVQIGDKKRIKDGKQCQFRCFSASAEVLYPATYEKRRANLAKLRQRTPQRVCNAILSHLPKDASIIRLHVSGDFFNKTYLRGVLLAVQRTPHIRWYAYTKSLHLWQDVPMVNPRRGMVSENFFLVASMGGKYDHLAKKIGLRTCQVVFSEKEARAKRLPIDKTDELAATPGGSFAVLLHGTQPKGSEASLAWRRSMVNGGGYKR